MNAAAYAYRGSLKHKKRPSQGAKGTLCPEWTHSTLDCGFGNEPFEHNWSLTEAHKLLANSTPHPDDEDRRYATMKGIAFEAKPTNDGTWHGYPVPWEGVPSAVIDQWLEKKSVTNRQIRDQKRHSKSTIDWALDSDTR